MTVVTLPTRFDAHAVSDFQERMAHRIVPETRLDLGDVRFIDEAGLSALVQCRADALMDDADCRVVSISAPARAIVELSGLAGTLGIERDVLEAA